MKFFEKPNLKKYPIIGFGFFVIFACAILFSACRIFVKPLKPFEIKSIDIERETAFCLTESGLGLRARLNGGEGLSGKFNISWEIIGESLGCEVWVTDPCCTNGFLATLHTGEQTGTVTVRATAKSLNTISTEITVDIQDKNLNAVLLDKSTYKINSNIYGAQFITDRESLEYVFDEFDAEIDFDTQMLVIGKVRAWTINDAFTLYDFYVGGDKIHVFLGFSDPMDLPMDFYVVLKINKIAITGAEFQMVETEYAYFLSYVAPQICQSYGAENAYVYQYFGTFNKTYIVRMSILGTTAFPSIAYTEDIVGYNFFYGAPPLRAWNNGEFLTLTDAYEKGLLNADDIAKIWDNYRKTNILRETYSS